MLLGGGVEVLNLYDEYYNPDDDMDFTEDADYDDSVGEKFAKDMFDFLTDIIKLSGIVSESFTSDRNFNTHFAKHCIGNSRRRRRSTPSTIYYDFTDSSQYFNYEKDVSKRISETDLIIESLDDYDTAMQYMRKLFEGNCAVTFAKSCGLRSNNYPISVSLVSYSSDNTKNYGAGNTIDVCIKGRKNRTVTLYAVDAHRVQNRLNSIIRNYSQSGNPQAFTFNND